MAPAHPADEGHKSFGCEAFGDPATPFTKLNQ